MKTIRKLAAVLSAEGLKVKCVYGDVELNERQSIINDFKQGMFDVLITNLNKNIWQDVKTQVPNRDLKAMVESYKARTPHEKATQPRESAREKLDALVKDTAAKVSIDKSKRTKAKTKGPELSSGRGSESCLGTYRRGGIIHQTM